MITIKISGPQGTRKSLLARAIYALADKMGIHVEVLSTHDDRTFVREERG